MHHVKMFVSSLRWCRFERLDIWVWWGRGCHIRGGLYHASGGRWHVRGRGGGDILTWPTIGDNWYEQPKVSSSLKTRSAPKALRAFFKGSEVKIILPLPWPACPKGFTQHFWGRGHLWGNQVFCSVRQLVVWYGRCVFHGLGWGWWWSCSAKFFCDHMMGGARPWLVDCFSLPPFGFTLAALFLFKTQVFRRRVDF